MRQLPLYPDPPRLAVELAHPRVVDPVCNRCALGEGRKHILLPERFDAPGEMLLVVGDHPGRAEDAEGRPFVGAASAKVRPLLRRLWPGSIVLDNAVRCVGAKPATEKDIDGCRCHLAATLAEVKPDRVLLLGEVAAFAFLGRSVRPLNARKTYTWLWNSNGDDPVPVFVLLHPRDCGRNRFLWKYLEEDMAWALRARLQPPVFGATASLIETPEDSATAVAELLRYDSFAFDLEYAGEKWGPDFRVLELSAAGVGGKESFVWGEKQLKDETVFAPLRALLEDASAPKGGANVKVDQAALKSALGCVVRGIAFDVRLQRKLLDPEATGNLEDMAELVGMGGHKAEAEEALGEVCRRIAQGAARKALEASNRLAGRQRGFAFADELDDETWQGFDIQKYVGEPKAIAFAFLEPDLRKRYAARDALSTAKLESRLSLELARHPEQAAVWEKVVLPAAVAIQRVEEWGVPFDISSAELMRQMALKSRAEAYEKVQKYARGDEPLNVDSAPQLARVLYDELGLHAPFKTESGAPSTAEEALSVLKAQHPLPGYILEYRHHQKLVGYAEDWLLRVSPDGRIRPSIHLDGARSGRTSASNPNLQNLPRATDPDGKRARDCFRAPPGKVLVELDYSQLELRIAALLSRDDVMAELFKSGVDFHLGTAKLICELAWNISQEQVTDAHRTGAKAFNFGIAYGKTDRSLAAELGIDEDRAATVRAAIFGKFIKYGRWTVGAVASARSTGGCWTIWEGQRARWRPLWRIGDDSEEGRHAASNAKNGSINSPIQGTASEFCVCSIARVVTRIDAGEIDAELVLPVHDSLMLVAPKDTWQEAARAARHEMMNYPWATDFVPLEVDVKVGERWGSMEKVKGL